MGPPIQSRGHSDRNPSRVRRASPSNDWNGEGGLANGRPDVSYGSSRVGPVFLYSTNETEWVLSRTTFSVPGPEEARSFPSTKLEKVSANRPTVIFAKAW
jgi:hypothetical protein